MLAVVVVPLLAGVVVLLLTEADGAAASPSSQLPRKRRKTAKTTVAGIEEYFRQVDLKQNGGGMADAQDVLEPYPWDATTATTTTTTRQFSLNTDPPEPLEPPTDEPALEGGPTLSPVDVSEECRDADREESMLEALAELTPESRLRNSVTEQGMAYLWILDADENAQINACMFPALARQRYALAVFYYATSGDSWTDRDNWLSDEPECQWARVTCHPGTGRVSALRMVSRVG